MSNVLSGLRAKAGIGPIVIFVNLLYLTVVGLINYFMFPSFTFSNILTSIAGIVLIIAAAIMIIAANLQIHKALSAGKLLTKGVYSIVRHPLYSAFTILFLPGVALVSGFPLLLTAPIFGYLLLFITLPIEEKTCEKKWGKEYDRYRKKVGAIFPRITK